jgi:hypothetical protein
MWDKQGDVLSFETSLKVAMALSEGSSQSRAVGVTEDCQQAQTRRSLMSGR